MLTVGHERCGQVSQVLRARDLGEGRMRGQRLEAILRTEAWHRVAGWDPSVDEIVVCVCWERNRVS